MPHTDWFEIEKRYGARISDIILRLLNEPMTVDDAAEALGVSRPTLSKKMAELGIEKQWRYERVRRAELEHA